ncbi:MAG TPA: TrkA family potassium uptake protein [Anaerolineae bacterium]|nr:TrkA family potassium uptake protein [Anaerolineae bacterium]HQH38494.1 TrkA family potassium uptake protein [Anaerolineae bacterium]
MKVIVIGCGRMGSTLARKLSLQGNVVTVVAREKADFERLGTHFVGKTLVGIEFDQDVLSQAGIQHCDALAAVTSVDEVNVVVARLASHVFHVPRVLARVFDPRKAEIYRRLGLQTIDPTTWGVRQVADLLAYSSLDTVLSLGGGGVDIVASEVPPLLVGRTVRDLDVPGEVRVVAISRGGHTFLPTLATVFSSGDILHLAVSGAGTARLRSMGVA